MKKIYMQPYAIVRAVNVKTYMKESTWAVGEKNTTNEWNFYQERTGILQETTVTDDFAGKSRGGIDWDGGNSIW